jgi:hypothetical protein
MNRTEPVKTSTGAPGIERCKEVTAETGVRIAHWGSLRIHPERVILPPDTVPSGTKAAPRAKAQQDAA